MVNWWVSEWFLRYNIFKEMEEVRHTPLGTPQSVSLDLSYQNENEYVWFRGGDLNDFWGVRPLMKWKG